MKEMNKGKKYEMTIWNGVIAARICVRDMQNQCKIISYSIKCANDSQLKILNKINTKRKLNKIHHYWMITCVGSYLWQREDMH